MIEIGLPDKLNLYRHVNRIEIVRKWFSGKFVFLTFFVIFWDGFLFFWYSNIEGWSDPMAILFPLLHVGVGIGLTYYVIAGWLNRTYILVSYGELTIQHRPIPWLGSKTINTSDLKQLYSKEKISHSSRGGTSVSYEVHAITQSGRNIKLLSGLDNSEQALYIEQEIEKYLNIKDSPVKGEIGG